MRDRPKNKPGDIEDPTPAQGLILIRNFRDIEDAETRDLILRLVEKLAKNSHGAQ